MRLKQIFCILIAILCVNSAWSDTVIQMEEYGGVYRIPCTVNGAKMKFIFDTGASNVCLSMSMAEYLYDNEYISKDDILGTGSSSVADGGIVDHVIINLRNIEIAGQHLNNVQAVVIDGQNAPLLMGQSAIQKLGSIELNGNLLTIHNDQVDNSEFIDNLFKEASTAYENKLYDRAVAKYSQLHSMNQLSDYGKYRYAWAALMNAEPQKAQSILNEISDFEYFEKKKIDIYRLLGFINQDLEKYSNAVRYFELSNKKIQSDYKEMMKNFEYMGDCHFYANDYSAAAESYRYAVATHGVINNIDMSYIQRDSKNRLKKKEISYRNDTIDYLLYQLFFCNERCGTWDTDGFLMEVTAMARAGNKYATKMLNKAGIDPYAECWR